MAKRPVTKNKSTAESKKAEQKQQQNRRELTGVFCLLIALLAGLCCIQTDAFLLKPIGGLIRGLI